MIHTPLLPGYVILGNLFNISDVQIHKLSTGTSSTCSVQSEGCEGELAESISGVHVVFFWSSPEDARDLRSWDREICAGRVMTTLL